MADSRGFKIGEEGLDYILAQLLEGLFNSRAMEIYAEDNDLRLPMKGADYLKSRVKRRADRSEARSRLRNLREGTPEWDIEFPRTVAIPAPKRPSLKRQLRAKIRPGLPASFICTRKRW